MRLEQGGTEDYAVFQMGAGITGMGLRKAEERSIFGERAELSEGLHHSWIAENFSSVTKLFSMASSLHKHYTF